MTQQTHPYDPDRFRCDRCDLSREETKNAMSDDIIQQVTEVITSYRPTPSDNIARQLSRAGLLVTPERDAEQQRVGPEQALMEADDYVLIAELVKRGVLKVELTDQPPPRSTGPSVGLTADRGGR